MSPALKKALRRNKSGAHVKEFGHCIGIVQGPTDYGTQKGPEVDVRWQPSNLRYAYAPEQLVRVRALPWKIVYPGRPDHISSLGYAAASWHSFDRRVWERDGHQVELRNLRNTIKKRVPGKIATYEVTLRAGSVVIRRWEGHDWGALVREAKRFGLQPSSSSSPRSSR